MTHDEFVKLSGQEITYQQYTEIVEPMYMANNMSKEDFVKFITPSCQALVRELQAEAKKNQKTVFVSDGQTTPNGCYNIGHYYKLVSQDTNISTGKTTYNVRELDDDEELELRKICDLWLGYNIDIRSDNPRNIINIDRRTKE